MSVVRVRFSLPAQEKTMSLEKKPAIATGSYDEIIKKACRKLHIELDRILATEDLNPSEKRTIFFDVLYSFTLTNVIRSGQPEYQVHDIIRWFFQHNKHLLCPIPNKSN